MKKTFYSLLSLMIVGLGLFFTQTGVIKRKVELVTKALIAVKQAEQPEDQDKALREFIHSAITDLNKLDFSPLRIELLANNIIQVSNKVFGNDYALKEHFVLLISNESVFDRTAKSTVGAMGLTQIMPKFAPDFAAKCGLSDFKQEDLLNETINLYLGACQFKNLLSDAKVQGNTVKALIAYNAGLHSKQMAEASKGKPITNTETSGYIQRFADKKEQQRIIKNKKDLVANKELNK